VSNCNGLLAQSCSFLVAFCSFCKIREAYAGARQEHGSWVLGDLMSGNRYCIAAAISQSERTGDSLQRPTKLTEGFAIA